MANILDELKGILSEAEFAKLQGNATLATRLNRGDELRSYYDGEEVVPAAAAPTSSAAATPAPANTGGQFDLGAIERMLDTKLGAVNQTIETKIADVVKSRGDELVNNAVKIALTRADELNRIYSEHSSNFNEAFDTTKFNEYLEANKDKHFSSVRSAYDSFIQPRAMEREVDKRVTAKMAEQSGRNVPGSTPGPSSNSAILKFMQRGKTGDGAGATSADRAATALDKIMARRDSAVA